MKNRGKASFAFTYNEVMAAFEDCVANKANTANAMKFSQWSVGNIVDLCNDINNRTYEIGMSITFVVKYPILREVFAADFRDRVVHHLVMMELIPLLEKEFIDESYSCRKGKGVLYGVRSVAEQIKECSKDYTIDVWVTTGDLKAFFMSIYKELLAERLDAFIVEKYPDNRKKEILRWLCKKIVLHRPELLCERRGDLTLWGLLDKSKSLFTREGEKGLPIGNLTSQVLANFVLTPLDKFIKEDLGFQYYGRYVDDFVLISEDKEKLKAAIPQICKFVEKELAMKIHPKKRYFQHYTKGVHFIGSVLKPNRTYIGNRTKGNLYYKIKHRFKVFDISRLDEFINVVNSYLGFMVHHSTYNIRRAILTNKGLMGKWLKYIKVKEDYTNIYRKNKRRPLREIYNEILMNGVV